MTLEGRVKALEDGLKELEGRMDTERLGEFLARQLFREWSEDIVDNVNERMAVVTKVVLANITQMRTWNDDRAEHYKSHYLDKKKKTGYASKRETNYIIE